MTGDPFTIRRYNFDHQGGRWQDLKVDICPTFVEHIVPPAGEDHAFFRQHYKRTVEISVSPTGRSVRIWVDGKEIR